MSNFTTRFGAARPGATASRGGQPPSSGFARAVWWGAARLARDQGSWQREEHGTLFDRADRS